jgi:hypothetical protein
MFLIVNLGPFFVFAFWSSLLYLPGGIILFSICLAFVVRHSLIFSSDSVILSFFLFDSTGIWTQGFMNDYQAGSLPLEPCLQNFLLRLFWWSHFLLRLASYFKLPVVPGMIGDQHHTLVFYAKMLSCITWSYTSKTQKIPPQNF